MVHTREHVIMVYMACQLKISNDKSEGQTASQFHVTFIFSISFDLLDMEWYTWLHIVCGHMIRILVTRSVPCMSDNYHQ